MHRFWATWQTTALEEEYLAVLRHAFDTVVQSIGEQNILAAYVGGSFSRREIVDGSDIDIYIVLRNTEDIERAINASNIATKIPVQIHNYSVDELSQHKHLHQNVTNRRMPPEVLLRELPHYAHIFGEPLDVSAFRTMSDQEYVEKFIPVLRRRLADDWQENEHERLRFIAKQLFFLIHHELRLEGKIMPFSRSTLLTMFPQDHLIHLCDNVRKNPVAHLPRKEEFILKVREYLDEVERKHPH